MKTAAALACALLALATANAHAQGKSPDQCQAMYGPLPTEPVTGLADAIDGDTLVFIRADGTRAPNVRLSLINAPEARDRNQVENPAGMRAYDALDRLLVKAGRKTTLTVTKWDRYCRWIADVVAGGTDLSMAMLQAGMARVYVTYLYEKGRDPAAAQTYLAAEREARDKRKGLWADWLGRD